VNSHESREFVLSHYLYRPTLTYFYPKESSVMARMLQSPTQPRGLRSGLTTGNKFSPKTLTKQVPSRTPTFRKIERGHIEKLAQILAKKCSATGFDRGQRAALESEERLDKVLLTLGLISEQTLADAYAELLGVPVADLSDYPTLPLLAELIKPVYVHAARVCPLRIDTGILTVALADGLDIFAPAAIAAATGYPVRLKIAVPIDLDAALCRLYPKGEAGTESCIDSYLPVVEEDVARLRDIANEAPIIRLVNEMVSRAVETKATDIHIEPFEDEIRVRYRYDGQLYEAESHQINLSSALISRVKIMAQLDIAERRLPQDGRIKIAVRGTEIDLRVSTIPSLHGETVVLRILDRTAVEFDFEKLGLPALLVDNFSKTLSIPNGIVLVTGPTGSGKTTTLYTALERLNTIARKVNTIEDPIEYQLKGLIQTQVRQNIGLTFAALLRNILRQDPDVLMVGEIRDLETAEIAVQAALTGHLVLSTAHTNSAAATITRLRDMGLADFLLSSVLRGVLAQRLVRQLCHYCKQDYIAPLDVLIRLKLQETFAGREARFWHAAGCDHCRRTGYKGRQAVAEFLPVTSRIQRLISEGRHESDIAKAAIEEGMVTMFQASVDLALKGTTSVEEIFTNIRE